VSLAGRPTGPVPVPAAVRAATVRYRLDPVWRNELGGLTFAAVGERDGERRFVKWAPAGSGLDLDTEAARMTWAAAYTPVPRPLARGADGEGSWLVTAALPGRSAVSPEWVGRPREAARAIGEGLRALHDALPVARCPFTWSLEERRAAILRQDLDPARWHPDHAGIDPERALALLADPPEVDRLVVCHGDACAPNTLIGADGRWSGHVDLGRLGVADRWADLAIATWSLNWNYGPDWAPELLAAYGVADDPDRTRWYRLLWDLAP